MPIQSFHQVYMYTGTHVKNASSFICEGVYLCKYFWAVQICILIVIVFPPVSYVNPYAKWWRLSVNYWSCISFVIYWRIVYIKQVTVSFTIVFLTVCFLLHRYAELHEDTGEPLRASTPLLARGVGKRRPGADGFSCFGGLCLQTG